MQLKFTVVAGQTANIDMDLTKTFNKVGGTIGRHPDSDWCLPDKKLHISNKHAVISFIDNNYFFIDNSSNGTYIKHPYAKLEKGEIQTIHNNDIFIIGHYEIQAQMKHTTDVADQNSNNSNYEKFPDDIQNIIPDDYLLVENEILDPLEMTSEKKEIHAESLESMELLDVIENKDTGQETQGYETQGQGQTHLSVVNERLIASQLETDYKFTHVDKEDDVINEEQNLFDAYFSSLGYQNNQNNHNNQDHEGDQSTSTTESQRQQLKNYGEITKTLLEAFLNIINVRTSIKNELKLPHTTLQQSSNNPFKFSLTVKELLDTQRQDAEGYLSIIDAIKTSVIDIQSTQVALLKASTSMSEELLQMLSPEKLLYQFEESGKLKTGVFKNGSAWKNYKITHTKLSDNNTVMNSILHKSFIKNYEEQVRLISISNLGG